MSKRNLLVSIILLVPLLLTALAIYNVTSTYDINHPLIGPDTIVEHAGSQGTCLGVMELSDGLTPNGMKQACIPEPKSEKITYVLLAGATVLVLVAGFVDLKLLSKPKK